MSEVNPGVPQRPSTCPSINPRYASALSNTIRGMRWVANTWQDDLEPIQQHAINSITDCQIQKVAHRKQGPVLPTLILNISPDPATDKLRKRRSSRTAGLTTTKETHPTSLWFRPGDDQYTLQDWAKFIQPMMQPGMLDRSPLSPISPTSPSFTNPFAPRREGSDLSQRPTSGHANHWVHHKFPNHTHSSRERPMTFSDSPSLRSKTSDISSPASSMVPHQMMHQNYTTAQYAHRGHPGDLPSPATTLGEYKGEFIEGWTSAQGRSSTLGSPMRERASISSQATPLSETMQSPNMSSQPPMHLGPRETILDRAFSLRCIPGSEVETPGEEKLTSLARFDALMREADERRRIREAEEAKLKAQDEGLKSVWDLDEDDDDDSDEEEDDDDDSEDDDEYGKSAEDRYGVAHPAQRALDYITGRHQSPRPQQRSRAQTGTTPGHTPLNYNAETLQTLNSGSFLLRPQTSHGRNRPEMGQRAYSQPQLAGMRPAPHHTALDVPSRSVGGKTYDDGSLTATASPLHRSATEKRASISSTNRLSFTELAKRLSSTSSLLLVQTNNSASSRGSSDTIGELHSGLRGPLSPRRAPSPSQTTDRDGETRCGWRGSVGVFGVEGGFL